MTNRKGIKWMNIPNYILMTIIWFPLVANTWSSGRVDDDLLCVGEKVLAAGETFAMNASNQLIDLPQASHNRILLCKSRELIVARELEKFYRCIQYSIHSIDHRLIIFNLNRTIYRVCHTAINFYLLIEKIHVIKDKSYWNSSKIS